MTLPLRTVTVAQSMPCRGSRRRGRRQLGPPCPDVSNGKHRWTYDLGTDQWRCACGAVDGSLDDDKDVNG